MKKLYIGKRLFKFDEKIPNLELRWQGEWKEVKEPDRERELKDPMDIFGEILEVWFPLI